MMISVALAMILGSGDALEDSIVSIAEKANLPGVGVALVSSKGMEWSFYHGVKKAGGDDSVGAGTVWHLGSCTKAMTAMAVCRQVDAGKLDLRAPLEKSFPGVTIDAGFEGVTLRHLMAHQAGLVPNLSWGAQKDREAVVKRVLGSKPASEVGKFVYSNTGFVLAGAAAEGVSGKTIEELIQAEMLALGVKSLGFGSTGEGEAWPHIDGKPMAKWDIDNPAVMAAAGTAHMTLPDWGKYISAILGGLEGKKSSLPQSYLAEIISKPLGGDYSMGWIVVDRAWAGGMTLNHAGSNTMNYSLAWLAPGKDKAILVMTNSGGGTVEKAADEIIGAVVRGKF